MKKIIIAILFSTTVFAQDITPNQVIQKYINAIGGKENFAKINDITMVLEGELMGQSFEVKSVKKSPNKYLMVQKMDGVEATKMIFNGENYRMFTQGTEIPLPDEYKEMMKNQNSMWPDTMDLVGEFKLELEPNQLVEGEDCYVTLIVMLDNETRDFYSVASGLKVKQEMTISAMTVTNFFKDYKLVGEGVLFPMLIKQEMMGMLTETKVTKVEINTGVKDSVFEIE